MLRDFHSNRLRLARAATLGLALALGASLPAAADDLVIGKTPTWARSVRADRQPGPMHDGSRPRAPLYFWMIFHGSTDALKHLREKGNLPIRHRWSVAVGGERTEESPDEEYVEKRSITLAVGASDKRTISALADQLAAARTFTWRTWSKKESVSLGTWRVEVLYDDENDTPVLCEVDGQKKPCRFEFKVK